MSYVKLIDDWSPRTWGVDDQFRWDPYSHAFPFVFNPRGVLVHRTKGVADRMEYDHVDGHAIHYWCENNGNHRCELLEFMPEGLILCARCESAAVAAGGKSAEELNGGKHVHVGGVRAVRHCCQPSN